MEYVQERIATLHDLTGQVPAVPIEEAAVVVPMTEREHAALPTEQILTELESLDPGRVVVVLRSPPDRVGRVKQWLGEFDLALDMLWCYGETVRSLLDEHGLDGSAGKGRDVWLGLGAAAVTHDYVICHDADTDSYTVDDVPRLLAPLTQDFQFTKGYYARVENNRLYGRLCRLLIFPLVRVLKTHYSDPIIEYIAAFRYPLAGEFGMTGSLARRLRVERRFGLEVGTLGDAFDHAGFDRTAQVDLGRHVHEHRSLGGPTGLVDMSDDVAAALFRVLEDHGIVPDYDRLQAAYRSTGRTFVRQYEADAIFNGLLYDRPGELDQIENYANAIHPPPPDNRLPTWRETDLDPTAVLAASRTDLQNAT